MKTRWKRIVALIAGGVALFWLLPWLILTLTGYELAVLTRGGDRSQTEVVDLSPRPAPQPLPLVPAIAPPRNVIFLLADGVGFSQLYAARLAAHGAHGRLFLERFPVTGWQTNPSIDDVYTDSAASASSLYTGAKVESMSLSIDPNGRPLRTLAEDLRDRGWAVGLITDSYLWDASVAAHAVHLEERYDMPAVAEQLAQSGFDLLVGARPEDDDLRGDVPGGVDSLVQPLREAGYEVVENPAGLPDLHRPTAVLFSDNAIVEGETGLAQISRWALSELADTGRPLFLFVEGEEADTGSHMHDFERVVDGVLSLDAAAQTIVDFAADRDDTLVLATSDHETGGFSILSGSEEEPLAIRWATTHHTSAPIPVLAWGAGAGAFGGVMDNTAIAERLRELLRPADTGAAQTQSDSGIGLATD